MPANPSRSRKRGHYHPSISSKRSSRKGDTAYRCSPHLIPPIMKLLSDEQRGFVEKIGFGSLLSMPGFEMNRALTMWLVDRFSCDAEALEFQAGVSVPVRPLVASVLGIPSGPIQVVSGLDVDDALYGQYRSVKGKNAKKLAEEMLGVTEEEPFCIAFVMAMLAMYLAPNTTLLANRCLFGAVQRVGSLKEMDWCGFVADFLFKGIRKFKESAAPFVFVKGCVHILNVIFIDLVKHAAFDVPDGFPRLGFVTTDHNKWVASHPFGSLPVRRLEESVYAPVLNNMGNGSIIERGTRADSDTNTDPLANQLAITVTHQNNQHPVSAGSGTARTTPNITSLACVEYVELSSDQSADSGNTPRVEACTFLEECVVFTRSQQLQSAGPSSEPYSEQITEKMQITPDATLGRNRGSPKDDWRPEKAIVELPNSEQVQRAGEGTIRMNMSLLSCRVCYHPVKPPVFQCNVGHLACGRCLAELPGEQCHICEHGGGFSPCPVMDDVVLSSKMKCFHDGCQSYVPYHELDDHQRVCPHAPCFCMEPRCGFGGPPPALLGHLTAVHSVPVQKVHYGNIHRLRLSEPRCLLHAEEDDGVFLLAVCALGMATVVSAVCIRAGASPELRYSIKLRANGPPPPSSAAGSILLDIKAVTNSRRPGEVAVEELPSFLMVPPTYLVGSGASKEVSLDIRIDKM
ncbi:E3 ubiquitin-protein ligase SINA-like 10 [Hordeum vulgare]|nr:E3 ubiquitin-protein ligase SINA-like 10 [Hordeum vulgare]